MDNEIDKQDPSSTEGGQVKVGDKLILRGDRYSEVITVDNVTKTGRVRAGGYEFNKDLSSRGRGRYRQAEIATPEKLEEVEAERKIRKARNFFYDVVWWKVPDSVVLAIAEAYGLAMEKHDQEIEVQGE